jgi:hypothetical protein
VFTLPVTGPYVIRVSATNLVTTGSYNLNRECLFPTPSPDAAPLPCGTLASGRLETVGDTNLFTFSGQAGEIVSLALASTAGFSTNPGSAASVQMELFAPTGARVGILRSNSQNVFTLPVSGPYAIRVSATNLTTVGSYELRLNCPQ